MQFLLSLLGELCLFFYMRVCDSKCSGNCHQVYGHGFGLPVNCPTAMENSSPPEDPNTPFIFGGMPKKRKLPLNNNTRPSKMLITEVAHGLDNLQLINSGPLQANSECVAPVVDAPSDYPASNNASMDMATDLNDALAKHVQTWADFQDDPMDVDQSYPTVAGRRRCPQLEMTDSLKAAIKLAEQTEEPPLPENILGTILRPVSSVCMAIVPYTPPVSCLPLEQSDSASISTEAVETVRNSSNPAKGEERMNIDDAQSVLPENASNGGLLAGGAFMR
ncbi:uncharacterized protein LOC129581295 [Paramacrobiotus metropolitanus]|uniref:uncharacterized protein LOC129581295 n=1 Tax=Paramacrobiotus metropolitanus TaxID=2943436 RepID=UPI0024460932|nr:uncharacterized protein LOC129581295 [Paramacrobiotus metropolitanus]